MTVRTLRLRKETLAELTSAELAEVVGGTGCPATADVTNCLRHTLTACPDYYCTGTC
ncbi:MAG TPA: class I lanthipeptide [Frankiaceae bacterium]|nr:class I lanthipeptide [Frankiaceae bacterium]